MQTGTEDTGESRARERAGGGAANRNGSTKTKRRRVPSCHGSRLNPIARHVRLQGQTIDEFHRALGRRSAAVARQAAFSRQRRKPIAADLVPEIAQRLQFMENVGLGYLALGRSAKTLERRRIAAHPARGAARLESARRALRARRADDRAASAGQSSACSKR